MKTVKWTEKESIQILKEAKENYLKQEILEEVLVQKVQQLSNCNLHGLDEQSFKSGYSNGFVNGVKWRDEQIPSIINEYLETAFISIEEGYMNPIKWFEEFKKK